MNHQESINLVSSYAGREEISGPGKVLNNLVKGLHKIGQPYVVNRALDSTQFLWVHSDLRAIIDLPTTEVLSVLGPNVAVFPGDLPGHRRFANSVYLQPSEWAAKAWVEEGFNRCPLRVWPTGIDTDEFAARPEPKRDAPILLYHKQRAASDLARVEDIIRARGLSFQTVSYGSYSQKEYIGLLRDHAFVVWLGCHESQGIALQEALAMDVPMLVIDAASLFVQESDFRGRIPERLRRLRTTSAPYFDSRCGIVVDDVEMAGEGLDRMRTMAGSFRPRDYILENLSLERQASRFAGFFSELLARHPGAFRLRDGHADRPYKPGTVTRVRAKVSIKSKFYAMKFSGIFR